MERNIAIEKQINGLKTTIKKYRKQNNEFRKLIEYEIYYKIKSIPITIHYVDCMIERTSNTEEKKKLQIQKYGLLKEQEELSEIYKKVQRIMK